MKKSINQLVTLLVLAALVNILTVQSITAEEPPEEEEKEPLMYYRIDPNILTFYQNTGKKLGYVVVQIQVAVRGQDNYDAVEFHLPLMQDTLIDFFNRQTTDSIKDLQKREELRQQATARVAEVLKEETGKDLVEDILFTQYVFQ
jgi:flagellar FliL protein